METYLYLLTNQMDALAIYVGITNDPPFRMRTHKKCARLGDKQRLYYAMRKHGSANFSMEVIDSFETRKDAELAEQALIELFRHLQFKVYNTTSGGDRSSCKLSSEQERQFCDEYQSKPQSLKALEKKWKLGSGTGSNILRRNKIPIYPRKQVWEKIELPPRSPEHLAKVGAAHKGKTISPEHKARLRELNTGKHLSPETRARISESVKRARAPSHSHQKDLEYGNNQRPTTIRQRQSLQ